VVGRTIWLEGSVEVDAENRAEALKEAKAQAIATYPSDGLGELWRLKGVDNYTDASKVKHIGQVVGTATTAKGTFPVVDKDIGEDGVDRSMGMEKIKDK